MKLKSLLFGSAAVLAAGTGAQAADLPTVEPVEYVRICDAFGTGFFYIPGTDTCLKLSGYVRAEWHVVDGFEDNDLSNRYSLLDGHDHQINNYSTRVRGHVEWDARTQTDFGLIRAFIAMEGTRGEMQPFRGTTKQCARRTLQPTVCVEPSSRYACVARVVAISSTLATARRFDALANVRRLLALCGGGESHDAHGRYLNVQVDPVGERA